MLICHRCDRELGPEHDAKACERKFSRRFFFGVAFGGLAAAVAKVQIGLPNTLKPLPPCYPWLAELNEITTFKTSPLLFRLKDADYKSYYSGKWLK